LPKNVPKFYKHFKMFRNIFSTLDMIVLHAHNHVELRQQRLRDVLHTKH
uniref:Alpha-amylase n=1 Tax=Gongylonema pulchrum TaxID=637853 RepID=A0A183D2E3_9BILA